jgi:short-subunit dehydrogenase
MKSLTILITGATAGIGRHAALHLARKGHRVIATGRREDALAALSEEAKEKGGIVETIQLDVTDPASIAAAKAKVDELTQGRGLDALVNNAGYGLVGPLSEIDDAELRAQFDTNVFGLMAMTRAFVPQMRARGKGRVVNVGSMGGRVTFPFMGAYHATKYALEAISDALRNELAPFGIGVSLIEPGVIKTEFTDRAMGELSRYDVPGSPYAPIFSRANEMRAKFDATGVGPEVTSEAIEHAIVARRPRARYLVPFRVNFFLAFFKMMPTRWIDAILRGLSGLTRARLAAPPPRRAELA